jgi:folate-dependent phosphoribosylglycinamide formyltransferase PurN
MAELRMAVLLSGGGRTLDNFFAQIDSGELPATVVVVVASRPDAGGLDKARSRGVPAECVRRKDFTDDRTFSDAITDVIAPY